METMPSAMACDPAEFLGGGAMAYSIGLGLTNECNLACPHCYRDVLGLQRLSLADVQRVFQSVPVASVNLGYGENGLHPEFAEIVEWLSAQACLLTFTSNSYTVKVLPDHLLLRFRDVELSLDFPDQGRQDAWRGEGNFQDVLDAVQRVRRLGLDVTILAVMMRNNYTDLVDLGRLAFAEGARFRVNVYQAAKTDLFALTYEEYWEGFRRLLTEFALVTTTEPVLAAALGLQDFQGCGCGTSTIRVMPNGNIVPCTYWPEPGAHLQDLPELGEGLLETPAYRASRQVPEACRDCAYMATCHGGCAGRRALSGSLEALDHYCRLARKDPWDLPVRRAAARDLPKSRSACTTVFAP